MSMNFSPSPESSGGDIRFEGWRGKCVTCKEPPDEYNPKGRLCASCKQVFESQSQFQGVSLEKCFVTIFPEPPRGGGTDGEETDWAISPEPCENPSDYSDLFVPLDDLEPYLVNKGKSVGRREPAPPFKSSSLLPSPGFSCGQPRLYEHDMLSRYAGFKVSVLDFSHMLWSGTIKDVRSWGILSLAAKSG